MIQVLGSRREYFNNMPNSNSAKKRLRQNVKRRAHNRTIKSAMRNQIRKVSEAMEASDKEQIDAEFRLAGKKIDQAASKNIIHKNTAARMKSRMARRINQLSTPGS